MAYNSRDLFKRLHSPQLAEVWALALPKDLEKLDMTRVNPAMMLTTSDLIRYHRFRVKAKKTEMLISRIFLRWLLNKYVSDDCNDIRIIPNDYGKPFLYRSQERLPLYFNLSHTLGMMICVFSLTQTVGADVEYICRDFEFQVEDIFSPEELTWCRCIEKLTRERQFTLWTLKEAFLKAAGAGFLNPIPLNSFWFSFQNNSARISFINKDDFGGSSLWHFNSSIVSSEYVMSQAIKAKSAPLFTFNEVELPDLGISEVEDDVKNFRP